MRKKILGILLSACVVMGTFAGCGQTEAQKSSEVSENSSSEEVKGTDKSNSGDTAETEELVELTWILLGVEGPANLEKWLEGANEYLREQIGVKLDIEFYHPEQIATIRQSNSGWDIVLTVGGTFYSEQEMGIYADISPYLETVGKEMYDSTPAMLWDSVRVDNGVYGIPVYKDISATYFFFWDSDICEEYGVDYTQFTSLQSPGLTEALLTIKEGTGEPPVPLMSMVGGIIEPKYDKLSMLGCLGIAYGDDEGKVVSVYEQEDVLADLKVLRDWYEQGIINSDANIADSVPDYKVLQFGQSWPSAANSLSQLMGCNVEAVQWGNSVLSNTSITGCINAVSSNCENPEKAVEFMNFVNTDPTFRDMLKYGIEGENFQYNENGLVSRLNSDWNMPNYEIGTFFVGTPEEGEESMLDEVKQQNESAIGSVAIGLNVDHSEFEDELANCTEVYGRYEKDLLTGAVDPDDVVPKMLEELKAAGLYTIIEKVQAQVDAHLGK